MLKSTLALSATVPIRQRGNNDYYYHGGDDNVMKCYLASLSNGKGIYHSWSHALEDDDDNYDHQAHSSVEKAGLIGLVKLR